MAFIILIALELTLYHIQEEENIIIIYLDIQKCLDVLFLKRIIIRDILEKEEVENMKLGMTMYVIMKNVGKDKEKCGISGNAELPMLP
jgi:hypothetical protein